MTAAIAAVRGLAHRPRQASAVGWLTLVAVIAAAYGWTLNSHFVADDFGLIARFNTFPWASWPTLFFEDWSHGIWESQISELRPIAALAFMIDGRVWGNSATGFHLTNLILHLVCSALVMLIAYEVLNKRRTTALAAGLIFALHPVSAGAVVWVSGRVDLLSTAGLLLGFLGFLRYRREGLARWLILAWCAFLVGVFAKESCLLLPAIAGAHDLATGRWRAPRRLALAPYGGWAVVFAVYAYCRSFGMDAIITDSITMLGPLGLLRLMGERILPYASAMFVAPTILRVNSGVARDVGILAIAGAGVLLGAVALVRTRSGLEMSSLRSGLFFVLAWPLITAAPLVVTYLAFRHLYPAAAGFAIGVVALLAEYIPGRRRFVAAAAGILALSILQLTVELPRFQYALEQSRAISVLVGDVARMAAPGDVLVLDVPGRQRNTWVWAWASPFALRPPFVDRNLTTDLVVIERPTVYRRPDAWPRKGTRSRLREAEGEGWLIAAVDGEVALRRLSNEELGAVRASPFASGSFDALMDELGDPGALPQ
jgi:hypothetical protein